MNSHDKKEVRTQTRMVHLRRIHYNSYEEIAKAAKACGRETVATLTVRLDRGPPAMEYNTANTEIT